MAQAQGLILIGKDDLDPGRHLDLGQERAKRRLAARVQQLHIGRIGGQIVADGPLVGVNDHHDPFHPQIDSLVYRELQGRAVIDVQQLFRRGLGCGQQTCAPSRRRYHN